MIRIFTTDNNVYDARKSDVYVNENNIYIDFVSDRTEPLRARSGFIYSDEIENVSYLSPDADW